MEIQKISIKIFNKTKSPNGTDDFLATFNEFIANHTIEEALIDVADYSHMHNGPGILLAGHEANWSYDEQYSESGILRVEKTASKVALAQRLENQLKQVIKVCKNLEKTPRHKGLSFDYNEFQITINDRSVQYSGNENIEQKLEEAICTATEKCFDVESIEFSENADAGKRISLLIKVNGDLIKN